MMSPQTGLTVPPPLDHLGLIAEMSRDFAESQDIDSTLQRGLERIAQTLEAEGASLFLLDDADGGLVCRACYGPVDIAGIRLPIDSGIVGRSVRTGEVQAVSDAHDDPDFGATVDARTGFRTRAVLCAPLRVREQTLGAIELINKRGQGPFNAQDAQMLGALATSAALAIINARLAAAMVEREGMRRELELTAAIQRSFLPPGQPAAFPVHGLNVPARQVSGDFYDILQRDDGRIWFCIGDVAGKGSNAALLMAKANSLFHYLAKTATHPGEVLSAINHELYETAVFGIFVTMICGVYEPASGELHMANAGHEAALLVPRGGEDPTADVGPAQSPPLGIQPDLAGPDALEPVALALHGRNLYFFTDGLTEARGAGGEAVGRTGMSDAIRDTEARDLDAPERLQAIVEQLAPSGTAPADDLTLLVVEGPEA